MKRCIWIILILALATHAVAATEPSMQRILATSPKVTVDPTNTATKARVFVAWTSAAGAQFRVAETDSVLTMGGVNVPPGPTAQALAVYQPVTAGSHYATITVDDNLTTDPVVKITSSGILFNDSPSTYDDTALWTKFAEYMLKSEHDTSAAAVQAQIDAQNTQIAQLKAAMDAHGITVPGAAPATLDLLDFGTINVSTTKTLTTQIDNTGLGNLTMGTALPPSGTGASKFSVVGNCNNQVIPPSEHCIESIIFAPGTVAGTYTAQISFPHDAQGSPTLLNVTGTAQAVQTCSSTPYIDIANTATTASPVANGQSSNYSGIIIESGQTTQKVCKADFYVVSVNNSVTGLSYQAEIWSVDGTSKALTGTAKAVSDPVSGSTIGTGAYVAFTFPTPTDLVAGDAIVITRTDHGSNSTNYLNTATIASNVDGGYSHTGRWQSTLVIGAEGTTADRRVRLYKVQ